MNNSAAKVGEIFREAGTAFSKLSEMTMSLQPIEESAPGAKWTDQEVEMLRGCVNRFAVELNKISQHIKNRTMYHLRRLLEMDSGAIQDTSSSPPRPPPSQVQPPPEYTPPARPQTPQLTLNNYLQGFDDNNNDEDLLQSFNPEIVPPLPPEQILQPARIQHMPLFEFDDIQLDQINLDEINLVVPDLLKALDDFTMPPISAESDQNPHPYSQDNRDNEPSVANIGTLYAAPAATEYGNEIAGAFSSIRNETKSSLPYSNECHFSVVTDDVKWDIGNLEAKSESATKCQNSPTPERQFTWFKAGETSGHDSSYTGQIKITELPSVHLKKPTGPTGFSRVDERQFNFFNFRRTETASSTTTSFKESTETKEEKIKEKMEFFKYAQAREEQSDNLFNFRRAIEKRDQDFSYLKDSDKNKEGSPGRNRSEDNKPGAFFSFRQPAESRTSSVFGSLGSVSSRWNDEISDDASPAQPFTRCHSPLEIDEKATFLPIRADNKLEPFSSFSRAKLAQPFGARRSRRLSHTSAFTDFITIPAAESTSGRKREQRPRSRRRKAPADKSEDGTPAKRSRKNPSGPSAKALKDKKLPKTE